MSWLLIFAVPVAASSVFALVTWKPPAHPVHTSGAIAVQAHFAMGWAPIRGRVPLPTTSLDELRCEIAGKAAQCPDAATLTQRLWPDVAQTPRTLYVPMSNEGWFPGSDGLNVEFVTTSRRLFVHNYGSQALFVQHTNRAPASPQPAIGLLVVSTAGISSGTVTVVEDNWIERLSGDEFAGQGLIGTTTIP